MKHLALYLTNKTLELIERWKNDPARKCKFYRDKGCVFVNGPFCDMPNCDTNNNYLLNKTSKG